MTDHASGVSIGFCNGILISFGLNSSWEKPCMQNTTTNILPDIHEDTQESIQIGMSSSLQTFSDALSTQKKISHTVKYILRRQLPFNFIHQLLCQLVNYIP